MEIKDMQAFYAVVQEGNISHAALRLDVAQPALSRQMKRLEEGLGVQLFERGSRRIRLTEAGSRLYTRVEHILSLVDGTVREITEIGSGLAGTIRLGTVTSSGALLLPELMREFHQRVPQVTFQIWEAEGTRVLEMLDARVIEIGLTRTQSDENLYESLLLPEEPLMMVMSRRHLSGASPEEVRVEELREQPIILPLRWKGTFLAHCKRVGFLPHIICESDSIVQNVLAVRAGLGCALLPLSARCLLTDDGELVMKRLVEPEIMAYTVLSWLKNHTLSAAAIHFIDLFREMFLPPETGGEEMSSFGANEETQGA
ncbi:MAG: LysR family transcriptional regulator [Schwartzia sp. (in: firmicutes)]